MVPLSNDFPTWTGVKSLLATDDIPEMQTGFLPFLPHPVTEHSTVHTAMLNFLKVVEQLNQDFLPIFCDEGVFRIVLDIYLKCPDKFSKLIQMMGAFHMAKCVQHCIGKYIKGSGLADPLLEAKVFGAKVFEKVLAGANYNRCQSGFRILCAAIQRLKWKAFWAETNSNGQIVNKSSLQRFADALTNRDRVNSDKEFQQCAAQCKEFHDRFQEFSKSCVAKSSMCSYLEGFVTLTKLMNNLIEADRTGNWEGHLQCVQDLLPVFRECDSLN